VISEDTHTDLAATPKHMGYKNVTHDIRKDSITCGDNTENMGYKNVTHNKEKSHSPTA
jgi:hypothetical protein